MWIEILLGLLGLLALFYWWLTTKWDFWTKQGIYQIKPVFPVGSVPALFTKKEHLNDTFLKQAKETKGQLISKCLFGCSYLQFSQKMNEKIQLYYLTWFHKLNCFRSFLVRIEDTKKTF